MTRPSYRLDDVVGWSEDGISLAGTVVSHNGGHRRQVLSVRMADALIRVITVDLELDGEIITTSPSLTEARAVAVEYLARGHVPGMSETRLVNVLAGALVAMSDGRAA